MDRGEPWSKTTSRSLLDLLPKKDLRQLVVYQLQGMLQATSFVPSHISVYLPPPLNAVEQLLFLSDGISEHALLPTPCLNFLCDLIVIYVKG